MDRAIGVPLRSPHFQGRDSPQTRVAFPAPPSQLSPTLLCELCTTCTGLFGGWRGTAVQLARARVRLGP